LKYASIAKIWFRSGQPQPAQLTMLQAATGGWRLLPEGKESIEDGSFPSIHIRSLTANKACLYFLMVFSFISKFPRLLEGPFWRPLGWGSRAHRLSACCQQAVPQAWSSSLSGRLSGSCHQQDLQAALAASLLSYTAGPRGPSTAGRCSMTRAGASNRWRWRWRCPQCSPWTKGPHTHILALSVWHWPWLHNTAAASCAVAKTARPWVFRGTSGLTSCLQQQQQKAAATRAAGELPRGRPWAPLCILRWNCHETCVLQPNLRASPHAQVMQSPQHASTQGVGGGWGSSRSLWHHVRQDALVPHLGATSLHPPTSLHSYMSYMECHLFV